MPTRRQVLGMAAAAVAAAPVAAPRAQGRQTPRLIVGSSPGGPADLQGRALSDAMRRAGGALTVVENRPGAAGRLAVQALRQAPADTVTLLLAPGWQLSLTPQTDPHTPFDPVAELQAVGGFCEQEIAFVVGPLSRARTLAEFVTAVRASGRAELCASGGIGSLGHLVAAMFERSAGIELQPVPYRGAAPALQDLQAGHVASYAGGLGDIVRLHREGVLRVLATSGTSRSIFLPDVPTFKEAGHPDVVAVDWTAVFAHRSMPAAPLAELTRLLKAALNDRPLLATLERLGVEAKYIDPASVTRRLRSDIETMGAHVRTYKLLARP